MTQLTLLYQSSETSRIALKQAIAFTLVVLQTKLVKGINFNH
ncbi:hypothetical protein [Nostoc sp. NIES-3756]|nr:hypothetical protein [Nostoc sp. NIES-3756]